jgi:hypothetical protein
MKLRSISQIASESRSFNRKIPAQVNVIQFFSNVLCLARNEVNKDEVEGIVA